VEALLRPSDSTRWVFAVLPLALGLSVMALGIEAARDLEALFDVAKHFWRL
jgi:hypothetical protein